MASRDPGDLARLEMLLSGALVEFGGDLMNGRIGPQTTGSMNAVEPFDLKADTYIKKAEATGNLHRFMGGLLQSDKRYVRLIAKLVEFLRLQKSGIWTKISVDGNVIAAGQSDPRMRIIRILLAINGDPPISPMKGGDTHDFETIEAVKLYQLRHGLKQTGDIETDTLSQMPVSLAKRIKQIKINLERRRWQRCAVWPTITFISTLSMARFA